MPHSAGFGTGFAMTTYVSESEARWGVNKFQTIAALGTKDSEGSECSETLARRQLSVATVLAELNDSCSHNTIKNHWFPMSVFLVRVDFKRTENK